MTGHIIIRILKKFFITDTFIKEQGFSFCAGWKKFVEENNSESLDLVDNCLLRKRESYKRIWNIFLERASRYKCIKMFVIEICVSDESLLRTHTRLLANQRDCKRKTLFLYECICNWEYCDLITETIGISVSKSLWQRFQKCNNCISRLFVFDLCFRYEMENSNQTSLSSFNVKQFRSRCNN